MRIVIIDDENYMRVSLKSHLSAIGKEYKVVGEADNGEQGIQKIDQLQPDIILLDIKMPIMNGLQVIQHYKNSNSFIIIVLSSYNDYESVRSALVNGAFDYIHKPLVTPDILKAVLDKAYSVLSKNQQIVTKIPSKDSLSKRQKRISLWKQLIFKEVVCEKDLTAVLADFDDLSPHVNYSCYYLTVNDIQKVMLRYQDGREELFSSYLLNVLEGLLDSFNEIDFFRADDFSFIFLLRHSSDSNAESQLQNSRIIQKITDGLKQYLNIQVAIGVSSMHHSLATIKQAVNEAFQANSIRFFCSEQNSFYYHRGLFRTEKSVIDFECLLAKAKKSMREEDFPAIFVLYTNLKRELSILPFSYKTEVKSFYRDFYLSILSYQKNDRGHKTKILQEIVNAESLESIYALLDPIVEELSQDYTSESISNWKVQNAIQYIKDNYMKDINLNNIATEVNLNPSYLSRTFKQITGVSVISFINQYRVQQVIKILNDPCVKIFEAAELVGFHNINHFNLVFKKIVGTTPTEYRQKNSNS